MPFVPYYAPNRAAASIADLLIRRGDIEANRSTAIGNASANAALQSGQAWAGAIGGIGQTIAGIPAQIAAQKQQALALENQKALAAERQGLADERARKVADQSAIDAAFNPVGPQQEPLTRDRILDSLPGHLRAEVQDRFDKADQHAAEMRAARMKADEASRDYVGYLGTQIRAGGYDPKIAGLVLNDAADQWKDDPQTLQSIQRMQQQFTQDPSTIQRATDAAIGASKYKTELQPEKPLEHDVTKELVTPTGKVLIEAKAGPAKPPTAEQDKQRYVTIQQQLSLNQPVSAEEKAWASAYEKEKGLNVDKTIAAANSRLAQVQAQQNAIQQKAQAFTEAQAGRKELTDKADLPYLDAVEKAETIRGAIEAARNGNQEAAAVQPLLATLGLTTAEGVKRINMAEIATVKGAGSLFERIKGQVRGLVAGQPLSEKLQNDLTELAGMLEDNARKKYEQQFSAITKRYGLKDEVMREKPAAPAPPAQKLTPGLQGLLNR